MIFGFGGKKRGPTFRHQVESFWAWYATNSQRMLDLIDASRIQELTPEIQEKTATLLPRLSWVFGPGENGGHSFTVTGEGDVSRQFLAEQCRLMAPSLPGWTFYGSRQASDPDSIRSWAISLGDASEGIDAESMFVVPSVNEESERIDLCMWHDGLAGVAEEHHWQIAFLLLDEVLGEFGTQTLVGHLEFRPCRNDADAISIVDLAHYSADVAREQGWTIDSPLNTYSLYQIETPSGGFPRGDSIVGTTCHPSLVMDFLNNGGPLSENPLEETGAEFVYLTIDGSLFPDGQQVELRGQAEDALKAQLTEHHSGRTIGGAMGTESVYIDLLLLDGDNSRKIVDSVMRAMGWQGRFKMQDFTN